MIMSQTPEIPEGSADSIKIGSIGTIGTLMSQELNSMNSPQASSSFQKKNMNNTLVFAPKSTQLSEVLSIEDGSSDKNNPCHLCYAKNPKQKAFKNRQRSLILSNETHPDGKMRRNTLNKKGHACLVEIVDVKCNNPMSSRLKKFGFSKLSETIVEADGR